MAAQTQEKKRNQDIYPYRHRHFHRRPLPFLLPKQRNIQYAPENNKHD